MSSLADHVAHGFAQTPKTLSSKYFYDAAGSRLFQQIMALPEYYPTRTELGIFQAQGAAIVRALRAGTAAGQPLAVVELGAGDGLKTKLLLEDIYPFPMPVALGAVGVLLLGSIGASLLWPQKQVE